MIGARLKKSINEIIILKTRSALVIFSIILGVTGIGTVVTSYSILEKDLKGNFLGTNPAAAVIKTSENMDDVLVNEIKKLPYIADAEHRKKILGRAMVSENIWIPLVLFVVKDFENSRISRFTLEEGKLPSVGEMLVERDGFRFIDGKNLKDPLVVTTPGKERHSLAISGKVHDPGQAPAHMDHLLYGYINMETYKSLTGSSAFNELLIIPSEGRFDKDRVKKTVFDLSVYLAEKGLHVEKTYIPEPGEHPHQWQLNSLIYLIGFIGLLAFVLSGILVVNIISFLLGKQIRQIGIMKAVGATRGQIMAIYYVIVVLFSTVSLLFAVPMSVHFGKLFSLFVAKQLNFNVLTHSVPAWVYFVLIVIGLVFPVIAATVPVVKGTAITPREAFSDYGLSKKVTSGIFAFSLTKMPFVSSVTELAAKNTFRNRWRLVLTAGTLALGFALFMSSLNLRETLTNTLNIASASQKFEISYSFNSPQPAELLKEKIEKINGVERAVFWKGGKASIIYGDGTKSNVYNVIVPSRDDRMLDLPVISGTWLKNDSGNEIVVNNMLQTKEHLLRTGNSVYLDVNGKAETFKVIETVKEFGLEAVYMSEALYDRLFPGMTLSENMLICARESGTRKISDINKDIEMVLEGSAVSVNYSIMKSEKLQLIQDHLNILTFMVLSGAVLALIVGGLGFISTMNISILERTREIGVMKAVGASARTIRYMVFVEGIVIGVLSLAAGYIISIPLSRAVSDFLGMLIFELRLDFAVSMFGSVLSAALMLLFIKAATSFPGRAVAKTNTAEALAYE